MKETDPSLHSSVQDDQIFVQLAQTCSHPEPVEGSLNLNSKSQNSNSKTQNPKLKKQVQRRKEKVAVIPS